MTAMFIPTMAGLARMVPITRGARLSDVGANWRLVVYRVPQGRGALITFLTIVHDEGTAPSILLVEIHDAADIVLGEAVRAAAFTQDNVVAMPGWIWLAEGEAVEFRALGGGANTKIIYTMVGVEFDWVDVT